MDFVLFPTMAEAKQFSHMMKRNGYKVEIKSTLDMFAKSEKKSISVEKNKNIVGKVKKNNNN